MTTLGVYLVLAGVACAVMLYVARQARIAREQVQARTAEAEREFTREFGFPMGGRGAVGDLGPGLSGS